MQIMMSCKTIITIQNENIDGITRKQINQCTYWYIYVYLHPWNKISIV